MTKVGFHPAADLELRETASYYENHVAGLGEEFLAEVLGRVWSSVHARLNLCRK